MGETGRSRLAKSPLRPVALRLLHRLNPGDIHIWHPYYPRKIRLHSFHHKGYWFYRSQREQETSELYVRFIKPTDFVLEVGAHIGFQTLHFAALAPQGQVIAFEPGSNNLPYVLHNTAGVANVEIRRQAVGAESGRATFYQDNLTGQNNSLVEVGVELAATNAVASNYDALEVTTTTVDVVTLDEAFPDAKIDFMKVDVEGGEANVLVGAQELLERARPTLMVEVADANRQAVWEQLVQALNYQALSQAGKPLNGPEELKANTFFVHGT